MCLNVIFCGKTYQFLQFKFKNDDPLMNLKN